MPDARSKIEEFTAGQLPGDARRPAGRPTRESVKRILLCTGKVAYTLADERNEREAPAAIVRVEQLYPFPEEQLGEIFDRYPNANESVLGSGRAREHGGLDVRVVQHPQGPRQAPHAEEHLEVPEREPRDRLVARPRARASRICWTGLRRTSRPFAAPRVRELSLCA